MNGLILFLFLAGLGGIYNAFMGDPAYSTIEWLAFSALFLGLSYWLFKRKMRNDAIAATNDYRTKLAAAPSMKWRGRITGGKWDSAWLYGDTVNDLVRKLENQGRGSPPPCEIQAWDLDAGWRTVKSRD